MNETLKRLIPRALRPACRELVFQRAMKRFLADPMACARAGHPVLRDLVYGWGNEPSSAQDEYLAACIVEASAAEGPILECGSGLSTLIVGEIARRRGLAHWALEHTTRWAATVIARLERYGIDRTTLCVAPLRDHGDFAWYAPPLEKMPASFALVVCDGPPGTTRGGRYGLAPVVGDRLEPGCVLLLDDAGRDEERAIAKRWQEELGATIEVCGRAKPYIRMTCAAD